LKQLNLSFEEAEVLADFLVSDGFRALVKAVDALVSEQERAVLKTNLDAGERPLIYAKLRAEGARKLHADLSQLKQFLKGKEEPPSKKRS